MPAAVFHSVVRIREINHLLTPNPPTGAVPTVQHAAPVILFLSAPVTKRYMFIYSCSVAGNVLREKKNKNHHRFYICSGDRDRQWVMAESGGLRASGTDSLGLMDGLLDTRRKSCIRWLHAEREQRGFKRVPRWFNMKPPKVQRLAWGF